MKLMHKSSGKIVEQQDLGLYSGLISSPMETVKGSPYISWHGTPIDYHQFRLAVSFLRWTHLKHKVEGQVRLFYNEDTHKWLTMPLPQYIWSAGHTEEVEDGDEAKSRILNELMKQGFDEACTGHHHSAGGAFQSGDDEKDELSRHGFHFTVGYMGRELADFHCRATFKGINYKNTASEYMMNPNHWLPGLHNGKIQGDIAKFWLDLTNLPQFPEEWKALLVKRVQTYDTTGTSYRNQCKNNQPCIAVIRSKEWFEARREMFRGQVVAIYAYGLTDRTVFAMYDEPGEETETEEVTVGNELEDLREQFFQFFETNPEHEDMLQYASVLSEDELDLYMDTFRDSLNGETYGDPTPSPAESAQMAMQNAAAFFRHEVISETASVIEIRRIFEGLQEFTALLIRRMKVAADDLCEDLVLNQTYEEKDLRQLVASWVQALAKDGLQELSEKEWEAVTKAIVFKGSGSEIFGTSLFSEMRIGLKTLAEQGSIDSNEYNLDGVSALTK